MPLNFDTGAYVALDRDKRAAQEKNAFQNVNNLNQFGETLSGIGGDMMQRRQLERQQQMQDMLNRLKMDESNRETQKFNSEYGTPIDPNQMSVGPQATPILGKSSFMPGGQGQVSSPSPLIDRFKQWQSQGMKPQGAEPEFMSAMPEKERGDYLKQFSPENVAETNLKNSQADFYRRKPTETNYVIPTYDTQGNVAGFTAAPPGSKVVGGGKPASSSGRGLIPEQGEIQSILDEIDRVQELNKNSRGGILGNIVQKTESALNMGGNDTVFKNTADVLNTMQQQVARVLKSTFGGQLSDAEREYLNNVYGALPRLSQTERDIAMTNVKRMLQSKLGNSPNLQSGSQQQQNSGSGQIGRFKVTVH